MDASQSAAKHLENRQELKEEIGYLSQVSQAYGDLTVWENIEFFGKIRKVRDWQSLDYEYGITVGDVLNVVEIAIGGQNVSTSVEGRQRFPSACGSRKITATTSKRCSGCWFLFRAPRGGSMGNARIGPGRGNGPDGVGEMGEFCFCAFHAGRGRSGAPSRRAMRRAMRIIPLAQLATIRRVPGPPMISSENSLLRSIVYLNVRGRDIGSFVGDAKKALDQKLKMPAGYYVAWSGEYENQIHAKNRWSLSSRSSLSSSSSCCTLRSSRRLKPDGDPLGAVRADRGSVPCCLPRI